MQFSVLFRSQHGLNKGKSQELRRRIASIDGEEGLATSYLEIGFPRHRWIIRRFLRRAICAYSSLALSGYFITSVSLPRSRIKRSRSAATIAVVRSLRKG